MSVLLVLLGTMFFAIAAFKHDESAAVLAISVILLGIYWLLYERLPKKG